MSVFNELHSYDVIRNGTIDPMHDLLEGAIPFILNEFFIKLCEIKKLKLAFINDRIHSFNYGILHRKNMPTASLFKDCSWPFSAAETWSLLVHVPFIFDDFIDNNMQKYWEGLISIIKITEICFSRTVTSEQICKLENLIESHLRIIKYNYKLNLIPKHHILTHYPSFIRNMGPSSQYSAMRGEAKHKLFTSLASRVHNTINLCKTLAKRHQQKFCHSITHFNPQNYFTTGKISKASEEFVSKYLETLQSIQFTESEPLFLVNFINYFGHYRTNLYISPISDNLASSEFPEYHKIEHILFYLNKYYLLCTVFDTIDFNINKNAFQIKKNNVAAAKIFTFMENNYVNRFHVAEEIICRQSDKKYILRKIIN